MDSTFWDASRTVLAVVTPLVAIPLTVITFYLRSLREHQLSWQVELVRRFEAIEASTAKLRETVVHFERDYTTKEEWLRECMLARQTLEHLSKTAVRLETSMENIVSNVKPFLEVAGRMLEENRRGDGKTQEAPTGSESP